MKSPAKLLTIKEVSGMLSISVRTIYRLVADDKFPKPLKMGHLIRFRPSDIERYIAGEWGV